MRRYLLCILFISFVFTLTGLGAKVVTMKIEPLQLHPGESGKAFVTFAIPAEYHQSYEPGIDDFFFSTPQSVKGIHFGKTVYPAGKKDENGIITYYKSVTLTVPFTVKADAGEGPHTLKVNSGWQYCLDSGSCMMPDEEVTSGTITVLPGAKTGTTTIDTTVAATDTITAGQPAAAAEQNHAAKPASSAGWIKFMLMALIGGLILNVMPCVLPVLSIKAISIVKQSHEDKKQIMRHSFMYVLGIMVSFLILAILVIALKLSGEMVGWGFQFQNPWFVVVLGAFILLFALSLFDVFIIQMPGVNFIGTQSSRKGLAGSFLSGVFAVVLATPCTAPFLGAALGFAFSQPPFIILPFFLLIGLGLALPFILIGFRPQMIKIFPKPGEWMNVFKEGMGFLLLGTVVWLLDVLYNQVGAENLIRYIIFLLFTGFGAWVYGRFSRPEFARWRQWLFLILSIVIIVGSGLVLLKFKPYNPQQTETTVSKEEWQAFDPVKVQEQVKQGTPVFIDFTAKWCMTCKVNENTVLYTPEIKKMLADKRVSLFRADYTNGDKLIAEWLKKYNRAGVPLYLVFVPGQAQPLVLPEVITKEIVINALNQIK